MKLHKLAINRNNVFNHRPLTFESKLVRLKKLLKNTEDFNKLEITESNIDGYLNYANRVKTLLASEIRNKPKDKVLSKQLKEIITDEPNPLVHDNEDVQHRKLLDIRKRYEEEIRKHGEQTSIKEGFVYILVNPCYPEWIKAGMAFDYEKRLNVYNQYDPESRYSIIALRWTANRRLAEKILLEVLTTFSKERKGEWFKIDKDVSLNMFYSTVE